MPLSLLRASLFTFPLPRRGRGIKGEGANMERKINFLTGIWDNRNRSITASFLQAFAYKNGFFCAQYRGKKLCADGETYTACEDSHYSQNKDFHHAGLKSPDTLDRKDKKKAPPAARGGGKRQGQNSTQAERRRSIRGSCTTHARTGESPANGRMVSRDRVVKRCLGKRWSGKLQHA